MGVVLPIREVAKPWGKDHLPAPFTWPAGERIGEIWFEPPAELRSVLVKYIFTSEKLSVQVHPTDQQAAAFGESDGGKEECWLVIDAEPGASLGVGFRQPIDPQAMRVAALDGSIEDLLAWYPVKPGDFFYIPAGTVHAIGAGVSLIEIQQTSDITYRLYDYGRPRELHLERGIAVACGNPHDPALRKHVPERGTVELVRGKYFTAHRLDGRPDATLLAEYSGPLLVIPRRGSITVAGETIVPGQCALADSLASVTIPERALAVVARAAG